MEKQKIEEIKLKLYERLKPSGWAIKLQQFILSSDMDNILLQLYKESQAGIRFTPPLKQLFSAFEDCPYKDLKVLLIAQDPYPQLNVADGKCFSCSNTKVIQASLNYIHQEIRETVYNGEYTENPDLTYLAQQGVLLLNTALTTTVGKIGTHFELWRSFTNYLFDVLKHNNNGLIFLFLGKEAQKWETSVGKNNYILKAEHPAAAAYGNRRWRCNDIFNETNKILKTNNNEIIKW